jgi:hypothetical protein
MSIDQTKIMSGIGKLFIAPYGEAFPAITGATLTWGGNWLDIGATKGGTQLEIGTEAFAIEVDQKLMPVGHELLRQTGRWVVPLAETDIDKIAIAITNSVKSTVAPGVGQVGLSKLGVGPDNPMKIWSLGFEVKAPGSPVNTYYWRMYKIYRAIAMGTVGFAYRRGEVTIMNVEFQLEEDATQGGTKSVCEIVDMTAPAT